MKAVNILLLGVVFAPLLVFGNTIYQVNFFDSHWQESPPGDCLMILGSKVLSDNRPDLMMVERSKVAFPLITDELKAVILTGGTVDEKKPEAEVLQQILAEKGVKTEKMILEKKSTSTYQNLLYSQPHLASAGCKELDIVSHDFHLARVKMTAERLGIPVNRYVAVESSPQNKRERLYREYLAYTWYWLGWKWLKE